MNEFSGGFLGADFDLLGGWDQFLSPMPTVFGDLSLKEIIAINERFAEANPKTYQDYLTAGIRKPGNSNTQTSPFAALVALYNSFNKDEGRLGFSMPNPLAPAEKLYLYAHMLRSLRGIRQFEITATSVLPDSIRCEDRLIQSFAEATARKLNSPVMVRMDVDAGDSRRISLLEASGFFCALSKFKWDPANYRESVLGAEQKFAIEPLTGPSLQDGRVQRIFKDNQHLTQYFASLAQSGKAFMIVNKAEPATPIQSIGVLERSSYPYLGVRVLGDGVMAVFINVNDPNGGEVTNHEKVSLLNHVYQNIVSLGDGASEVWDYAPPRSMQDFELVLQRRCTYASGPIGYQK